MPDGDLIIDILTKRLRALDVNPSMRQQGTELRVEVDAAPNPDALIPVMTDRGRLAIHTGVSFVDTCDGVTTKGKICLPDIQDDTRFYLMNTPADLAGDILDSVDVGRDYADLPAISFRLNRDAARTFGELTASNVGLPFALVIDDVVIVAPRIQTPILGGSGQITAYDFDAEIWSAILSQPPLPHSLIFLEHAVVPEE